MESLIYLQIGELDSRGAGKTLSVLIDDDPMRGVTVSVQIGDENLLRFDVRLKLLNATQRLRVTPADLIFL